MRPISQKRRLQTTHKKERARRIHICRYEIKITHRENNRNNTFFKLYTNYFTPSKKHRSILPDFFKTFSCFFALDEESNLSAST